ncbi:MAG: hypothetical protein KGQ35_05215, partial [Burkholderiales bacterium]|nr:hypothetical protein [Burkholderiales bacterium]
MIHRLPFRIFRRPLQAARMGLVIVLSCALYACGGGGGGGESASSGAGATVALPTAAAGDANAVPIYVDGGLPLNLGFSVPNAIYADIEVCAPG